MASAIEARPQGETNLDPGDPPTNEPKGTGARMGEPVNEWDAAPFIKEGFDEAWAELSESDIAELVRDAQRDDHCAAWRDLIRKAKEYSEEQVHDVRMGYAPKRRSA